MTQQQIHATVELQRAFFNKNTTRSLAFRKNALLALQKALRKRENELARALCADLGKSAYESYMCEIGMVLDEIRHMLKHLGRYAKEKRVRTPVSQFSSRSYVKPSPYGVVLVMSPWNYPLLLSLDPLVDAIAAGNTVVLKPSAYAPHTAACIKSMLSDLFFSEFVSVIEGGREENSYLLDEKFDFIFFTGSKSVGREVMMRAAKNLTPVTLELGGKSPCIVDATANIELAARRIVFGKYLNCGQTCVAPDYIWCHASVKDRFLAAVKSEIERQYGNDALFDPDYGQIINRKHFERICALIDPEKLVHGGKTDEQTLKLEPTVLDRVTWDDAVMKEEIFGPIMPILTYTSIDEVIRRINEEETPLALYLFSSDKKTVKRITAECAFGGGCINDVIIHLATASMGFGGMGESGMGSYHGKCGFDCFSHQKSIVDKKTWIDLPMRYRPYRKGLYEKILRFSLK